MRAVVPAALTRASRKTLKIGKEDFRAQTGSRGQGNLRRAGGQAARSGDRGGRRGGHPAPLRFLRQVYHLPSRIPQGRAREDDEGRVGGLGETRPPRACPTLVP